MAIMAIWPFLAVMAHMAMADSKTNMAIIQYGQLTQQSWFQLSSTFHSKVMAIWSFVLGAYIVTYTLKITRLEPNLPPLEGIELQRFKRHFWKWHGSGNKMGGWPLLGFDFEQCSPRHSHCEFSLACECFLSNLFAFHTLWSRNLTFTFYPAAIHSG